MRTVDIGYSSELINDLCLMWLNSISLGSEVAKQEITTMKSCKSHPKKLQYLRAIECVLIVGFILLYKQFCACNIFDVLSWDVKGLSCLFYICSKVDLYYT